jgi:hypothetical protein
MKTILLHAATVATIIALGQATLYGAEEGPWTSVTDQAPPAPSESSRLQSPPSPFQEEDSVATINPGQHQMCYEDSSNADSCFGGCCDGGAPTCEQHPRLGVVGLLGFDSFHGFSDGDYQSKFGAVTGVNAGGPLPGLAQYGVGWQVGSTFGIYDWDGRASGFHDSSSMQQVFMTAGLFRKPAEGRLSLGVVYDWMLANDWGTFAVAPTLGQWRAQAEYAFSDRNSVGVFGTIHERSHSQRAFGTAVTIENSTVDQIDLFWHHKYCCGADSWLWVGVPDHTKLEAHGSLGEFILGGNVQIPLSAQIALYGNMQYMRPTASAGDDASRLQTYDIGVGIIWYPGRNAHTATVNGRCWTPYMPVANNASFLVDQNRTL